MRNRFSKVGRNACYVLFFLAASGVTSSCKDEYRLDDEKPSWLNSSIYESLVQGGKYKNYLRLLADPDVNSAEDADNNRGLVDILSKTGSKTVFVANDDAWKAFFESNAMLPGTDPWHTATSYEALSAAQKKLLIHTSMLNNAIVMENLASSEGSNMQRGEYMRRFTDVETTDSVTYLDGNSLPVNYNTEHGELDFWHRFRTENGGKGIHLVTDSTLSMMLHFTSEHLTKNNVTDEDFSVFMGMPRVTSDVHIYDAKLEDKDLVCENGYLNRTSKVLKPLANMAEVIRTNGQTRIFSHMLDRWSAPFYNNTVTEAYKNVMAAKGISWTDSIFTKRYFSDLSFGHRALTRGPKNEQFLSGGSADITLKFDPGWNAYYDEYSGPQFDMAAMYVPTDHTLWKYFTEGGAGWQLIQTYCDPTVTYSSLSNPTEEDYDKLFRNIDQIPLSTLRSLINVTMFKSFIGSVPSKMTKLRDDAQEQIFYPEDRQHITGSLLANNGVVYLTDKVYGPADYTSVAAPAYISTTNLVMKWAIYNGSTKATNHMKLNYYAYLKAMQSRFALFLPSDEGMKYLYDPVSFKSKKPRLLTLFVKPDVNTTTSNTFPIDYSVYAYTPATGEIGRQYSRSIETVQNSEITNRLKDILESHTIVLDGREEINSDVDEFYVTKNGSGVRVKREGGVITSVQGGFQMENEAAGLTVTTPGVVRNSVTDRQHMANGVTYILDSPIVSSARSVYNVMMNDGDPSTSDYSDFYALCESDAEVIRACGLVDQKKLTTTQQATELKKFQLFVDEKGPDYSVQFFNNFRYTIFVPTNAAVAAAVANGLPTWEDIRADFDACKNEHEQLTTTADSLRLQAKITYLTNFLRYHFLDNSVFVDKSDIAATDYVTASYDNVKGIFCKVEVQRQGGTLQVRDANAGSTWATASGKVNVMARDITCNRTPNNANSMAGITIDGSSFAVLHQIPAVLNHTELKDGRHDSTWANESGCKEYLKRFAIR